MLKYGYLWRRAVACATYMIVQSRLLVRFLCMHEQHQWTTFAEPLLNTFITASAKEFRVGIFDVLAWLYVIKYTFRISLLPNSLFFRIRSRTARVIAFKQIHTCANESKPTYMFVNCMHVITESKNSMYNHK